MDPVANSSNKWLGLELSVEEIIELLVDDDYDE